jgi:hypothetical protein
LQSDLQHCSGWVDQDEHNWVTAYTLFLVHKLASRQATVGVLDSGLYLLLDLWQGCLLLLLLLPLLLASLSCASQQLPVSWLQSRASHHGWLRPAETCRVCSTQST